MSEKETVNDAPIPPRLLGKPFNKDVLDVIRFEIEEAIPRTRSEIARRVSHRLEWKSLGGKYQLVGARVGLLRLHRAGLIQLPEPTKNNGNGRGLKPRKVEMPPSLPVNNPVHELLGLTLTRVETKKCSMLYNALIDSHHYLGYTPMAGAQVRYLISWDHGVLGAIGFGASAWKVAARDRLIGWSRDVRHKNLHLILNNSRFLILPWVHSPNLASKVLSLCSQRIPGDFLHLYGYSPVLLESFVERDRFTGHCYKAANWQYAGQTTGRGKKHVRNTPGVPVKDLWLYPLRRDYLKLLQRSPEQ